MKYIKEKEKALINNYLTLSIKRHFAINMDISNEYTFAENLVSKKMIIATAFTEKIQYHPEIKLLISSLINELNNKKCNIDFIKEKFEFLL